MNDGKRTRRRLALAATLVAATTVGGCKDPTNGVDSAVQKTLVGAWRTHIRATSGSLAGMNDLEFMLVFNAGGTMTESSNYDAAPPVSPAYGVWRRTGDHAYEAHYAWYVTKPPSALDAIVSGGGWSPAGRGELTETITLADDGRTYESTLVYALFDATGEPVEGGGEASATGARMAFEK